MWGFVFGGMAIAAIAGIIYLWTRFCKFGIVRKLAGDKVWLRRVLGLVPMLVFGIFFLIDFVNTAIVLVHMAIYWALAELILWIIRKIRKTGSAGDGQKEKKFQPYWLGIIVLVFELCYFSAGWYLAHRVWETDYQLTTTKELGMDRLRIAQISDSHVGTTFDGEGFAEHLRTVQATNPDILVITGDFVDDDTTKEDMLRCCEALKEFTCTYGVYYVYGNHDRGYRNYRNFTGAELTDALIASNVHVMEDEVELVDGKFYIVGRADRSKNGRVEIDKIVSLLDPSKYTIILDHQPTDYAAEAKTGADLVLSGHTHGGQMVEMNLVGSLLGANDRTYGMETRDKTTFIVSSGISDWSIKFKTGTRSEFCIIDVTGQ